MSLDINALKKELAEKENLKEQTERVLYQLIGQISLLRKLIKDNEEKPEIKSEEG